MQLTDEFIREFRALYLARFGVALPDDAAREEAAALMTLVTLLWRLD